MKLIYDPERGVVRETVEEWQKRTGKTPTIVPPYDPRPTPEPAPSEEQS